MEEQEPTPGGTQDALDRALLAFQEWCECARVRHDLRTGGVAPQDYALARCLGELLRAVSRLASDRVAGEARIVDALLSSLMSLREAVHTRESTEEAQDG